MGLESRVLATEGSPCMTNTTPDASTTGTAPAETPKPGTKGGRPLTRVEIEINLNEDRAWLLRTLSAMPDEELTRGVTHNQDDPEGPMWSFADHFIHTSLIEQNWNKMFRRHLAGRPGMPSRQPDDGTPPKEPATREEFMAALHAWNEGWAREHRGTPLSELIRIGLGIRADTLKLLSELTDEQLVSVIPNTPWADSTVGGIMAANASHGRTHYKWAKDGHAALEG
jgi:hypothetical protein